MGDYLKTFEVFTHRLLGFNQSLSLTSPTAISTLFYQLPRSCGSYSSTGATAAVVRIANWNSATGACLQLSHLKFWMAHVVGTARCGLHVQHSSRPIYHWNPRSLQRQKWRANGKRGRSFVVLFCLLLKSEPTQHDSVRQIANFLIPQVRFCCLPTQATMSLALDRLEFE